MSEGEVQKKLSRRDFLKVAGTLAEGLAVAETVSRIEGNKDGVDMEHYVMRRLTDGVHVLNFTKLMMDMPHMVALEGDGFVLKNESEKPITLDFSKLAGETIEFPSKNVADAAISNVSWENAKGQKGFGESSAGLVLNGAFAIKGNVLHPPTLRSVSADRVLYFRGNGSTEARVSDVVVESTVAFRQDTQGSFEVPSPGGIVADDCNLRVEGATVRFLGAVPDGIDESNAQLSKGISLQNTENTYPLRLSVSQSRVEGFEWDGICANGRVDVDVSRSVLLQSRKYKNVRGVGIASTFNTPEGKLSVKQSVVDYCKGTAMWTNERTELPRNSVNVQVSQSEYNTNAWAVTTGEKENMTLSHVRIKPYWDAEGSVWNAAYWPIEMVVEAERYPLSFDEITFDLSHRHASEPMRLMLLANFSDYQKIVQTGLQNYFSENIDHFGTVRVENRLPDGKVGSIDLLIPEMIRSTLDAIEKAHEEYSLAALFVTYDASRTQFGIQVASGYNAETEELYLSDVFYVPKDSMHAKPIEAQVPLGQKRMVARGDSFKNLV